MATIKKIKKAQTGETLSGVTVTSKTTKKPNLVEKVFGTPEKRAERKEEREGRRAERQSNREVRKFERQDRRSTRCTGGGCASRAGFGGYNKNGGVTKAKSGMKIKKKMQAGGVAGKQPKAPMVDPQGAYTKVQERTLGNMKKGGKIKKAQGGDSLGIKRAEVYKANKPVLDSTQKENTKKILEEIGKKQFKSKPTMRPLKKGGKVTKDKKWIQKAVNPKHKGYCTPMTKATCTPKRKALAMTFKKMAKAKKGK